MNYGIRPIKDIWELFNVAVFMYICQSDNYFVSLLILCLPVLFCPSLLDSWIPHLDSLYPDWILALSRYYMLQLPPCSCLGSPINGSACSPNHSVLQGLFCTTISNTQSTPSKNRILVVLISESS